MADNIQVGSQTGTGPVLASDQRSGDLAHFPLGKLVFGPLDTFTMVSTTDGLPVQPATGAAWVLGAGSAVVGAVTQSGTWNITNISGTVSLPTGAATAAKQPAPGTAGTASADVITVQGIASMTALKVDGSAVTQPISNTALNSIAADYAADAAINVVQQGNVTVIGTGTFATQAAQSGTWTVQPGNTANTTAWLVTDTPATSGGVSMSATISAASTNATVVKASAGQIYNIQVFNTNAAARYLKLYNKATSPTVGTDTPVKVITIPGNTAGAGAVVPFQKGLAFSTGIAFALTTGVANSDTGAVAANEIVVNIDYK